MVVKKTSRAVQGCDCLTNLIELLFTVAPKTQPTKQTKPNKYRW